MALRARWCRSCLSPSPPPGRMSIRRSATAGFRRRHLRARLRPRAAPFLFSGSPSPAPRATEADAGDPLGPHGALSNVPLIPGATIRVTAAPEASLPTLPAGSSPRDDDDACCRRVAAAEELRHSVPRALDVHRLCRYRARGSPSVRERAPGHGLGRSKGDRVGSGTSAEHAGDGDRQGIAVAAQGERSYVERAVALVRRETAMDREAERHALRFAAEREGAGARSGSVPTTTRTGTRSRASGAAGSANGYGLGRRGNASAAASRSTTPACSVP
jgi:hypothetical protein